MSASKTPVLVINGLQLVDFYLERCLEYFDSSLFDMKVIRAKYSRETDTYTNAEEVKSEIMSGKYGAVVVCDLSAHPTAHRWLQIHLGKELKAFVRCGGLVAFPTSEGLLLQPTLNKLFGTTWVCKFVLSRHLSRWRRCSWVPWNSCRLYIQCKVRHYQ